MRNRRKKTAEVLRLERELLVDAKRLVFCMNELFINGWDKVDKSDWVSDDRTVLQAVTVWVQKNAELSKARRS